MDSGNQSETLTLARITYQDPETGEPAEITIDTGVFVGLYHVTKTWGADRAHALLLFGASLVKPEVTDLDTRRLHLALTAMQRYVDQWDDPADLALTITYEQLGHSRMTLEQAATFASAMLDKPISPAAWQKRVTRWAAKKGLPAVDEAP